MRKNYNSQYRVHIKAGKDAIAALNKKNTGSETHIETFYDECGNRRQRFVPYAMFCELAEAGHVRLYQVHSDGLSFVPMHDCDKSIAYRSFAATVQAIGSYAQKNPPIAS